MPYNNDKSDILVTSNAKDINGNVGDFSTDPRLYFSELSGARFARIDGIGYNPLGSYMVHDRAVIVGGGGLLDSLPLFQWGLNKVVRNADPNRLVLWGAGHNKHGGDEPSRPDILRHFALVGLRDYYRDADDLWAPCVSAMLPELEVDYPIQHEAVVFDNWQFKTGIGALPNMRNNLRFAGAVRLRERLTAIIAFLGSAETVVTSSYHGAYLGALLGRKVVVARPFSSKFKGLKHQPAYVSEFKGDWRAAAGEAPVYPEALKECRTRTVQFATKVFNLLGLKGA